MKKLYLTVPIGACPNGQIAGIRRPNGSSRQIVRLFVDKGTDVTDADAKILLERYPEHYAIWTPAIGVKVAAKLKEYYKVKDIQLQKKMGPLAQPRVNKPPNRELEGVGEEGKGEEITDAEAGDPFSTTKNQISHEPPPDEREFDPDEEHEKEQDSPPPAGEPVKSEAMAAAAKTIGAGEVPTHNKDGEKIKEVPADEPPPVDKKTKTLKKKTK